MIELTWPRYLAALLRIRGLIAEGLPSEADDCNVMGAKHTECSWGLCNHTKEAWPDAEDHLWPDEFLDRGRVAPLYRATRQLCPFDRRDPESHPDHLLNGCFYKCMIFRNKQDPPMTREKALELYDTRIAWVRRMIDADADRNR